MQQSGLGVIAPLIAILLAGYLSGYFKLFDESASRVLSRFVYLVAMPTFIFISLANISIDAFFNWPFLAVLGGGMLLVFGISFLVARKLFPDSMTAYSLHALTAMFSSTAYIGLPVILIVFGDKGLVPGIIGAVITVAVFMPISILIAEFDKGQTKKKAVTATLLALFRNPLLLATVSGLLISASGFNVPAPMAKFFELLGGAFIPCALFAAGLFIAGCSVKGEVKEISWLVFAKLFLHPMVTWWLAYELFELEGTLAAIAVLQAALPSGVPVFVLAQNYNTFVRRSSAVIVVSTALSMLTLPILLQFLL